MAAILTKCHYELLKPLFRKGLEHTTTSVWGLYTKYIGEHGKLAGVFSTVDRAKECQLIQPLLQEPWQYRDIGSGFVLWRAAALDPMIHKIRFISRSKESSSIAWSNEEKQDSTRRSTLHQPDRKYQIGSYTVERLSSL